MKTKLTFQLIKYIAILIFIYLILIFFKILPSNETNKTMNLMKRMKLIKCINCKI